MLCMIVVVYDISKCVAISFSPISIYKVIIVVLVWSQSMQVMVIPLYEGSTLCAVAVDRYALLFIPVTLTSSSLKNCSVTIILTCLME